MFFAKVLYKALKVQERQWFFGQRSPRSSVFSGLSVVLVFFWLLAGCSTSPVYVPGASGPSVSPYPQSPQVTTLPPESGTLKEERGVEVIEPEAQEEQPTNQPDRYSPQHLASLELVDVAKRNINEGNFDQAINMLERAISLDAYNSRAYYYLSVGWFKKNQPSRALEFARKAELLCQGRNSELRRVYLLMSDIYNELGSPDKASLYRLKAQNLSSGG